MNYTIQFILVMLSVCLADICWTYYMIKVNEKKAIAAGLWSSFIVAFGAFTTLSFLEDKSFALASIIGAFIGTAGTVWYNNRKEKTKDGGGN